MFPKNHQTKRTLKLQFKLIAGVTIPLVIILGIVGTILYTQITSVVEDLKETEIESQTFTAAEYVDAYFQPFTTTAHMIKGMDSIYALIEDSHLTGAPFQESAYYQTAWAELQEASRNSNNGLLQAFVFSTANGDLLVDSSGALMDASFVLEDRTWFQQLKANNGNVIITSAYTDVVTGSQVVTIAVGMFDARNKIIGGVGMDISLDTLATDIGSLSIGKTGYLTVYDSDYNIVCHPDKSFVMSNISDMAYSSNMASVLKGRANNDAMLYTRSGETYCGAINYNSNINWTILGCMPNEEFRQEIQFTTFMIALCFILCAVILAAVVVLISSGIVRPIMKLNRVVSDLAEGNLDVDVQVNSNDEIGQLSDNISSLVDRLKTYIVYINEIASLLHEMGMGNLCLTFQNSFDGDFRKIKDEMENTVDLLNHALVSIKSAADQVDSGSDQVAAGAQALSQGAAEQASSTEQLSAMVSEINRQVQQAGEYAAEANERTNEAGRLTHACNQQMQEMVVAMDDISKTSEEIGKIIKTIEDIAFQTNILALNAAVEAARAGTAGKGFAVVADEVRNLAAKSAEASKNTATLIENSMAAVERGAKLAGGTAEQLQQVASVAQTVSDMVSTIAETSQEQTNAIQQVTTGLDQISAVVQTNSATAEESAAASEELASQATVMKNLVGKFNLNNQIDY